MLSTLTRYDGWAMFVASLFVVFLISMFRKKKGKEGAVVLFLFLAGFGIFLWLLYNHLIFGDPLYFSRSEFSAAAQQKILESRGQLPTKSHLDVSLITYLLAVIVNNGILVVITMALGIITYLLFLVRGFQLWKLMPLLLLVPFGFNVASLFAGQSVIWMPMIPPYFETYFNARYGLLMLPAVAFFSGFLVLKNKLIAGAVAGVILLQVFLFLNPKILPIMGKEIGIITLADTVSSINKQTVTASTFLREHHRNQLILISSASADAFIFRAGIPLRFFITEGTGNYWHKSLEDPTRHAGFVVYFTDKSDRVGKRMVKIKSFSKHYARVYQDQTYQIWQKK